MADGPGEKDADARRLDELLSKAESLKRRSDNLGRVSTGDGISESLSAIDENIGYFRSLTHNTLEGGIGFYQRFVAPVLKVATPPIRWVSRSYGALWNRVVYRRDPLTGERTVSRSRAGCMVAASLAVVIGCTPTALGDAVRFATIEPLVDGILIATSIRTEEFFLNSSEEIDPSRNIHSVRGCKSAGPCSEVDAAYFRVRPRLSHDIWKLIQYGTPFYVPDHVVAPIAPGVNRCQVTYYGYRMTSSWISRLVRSLEVYPTLLEATCTFVGSEMPRT